MFGVIEGFAIAGSVAAIITAFKDGGGLFQNWRARRKAKKEQAECEEVHRSLRRNPITIEKTYDDFHRTLGDRFGKGDDIAQQQLSRSLLKFTKTMIRCLTLALQEHADPDLTSLFARSEKTAKETLGSLTDLYQRLRTKSSIPRNRNSEGKSDTSSEISMREPLDWMPSSNSDTANKNCLDNEWQPTNPPRRWASDPQPYSAGHSLGFNYSAGNASIESLHLDLQSIRRSSSMTSLRGESTLVLARNFAILSRKGF